MRPTTAFSLIAILALCLSLAACSNVPSRVGGSQSIPGMAMGDQGGGNPGQASQPSGERRTIQLRTGHETTLHFANGSSGSTVTHVWMEADGTFRVLTNLQTKDYGNLSQQPVYTFYDGRLVIKNGPGGPVADVDLGMEYMVTYQYPVNRPAGSSVITLQHGTNTVEVTVYFGGDNDRAVDMIGWINGVEYRDADAGHTYLNAPDMPHTYVTAQSYGEDTVLLIFEDVWQVTGTRPL